MQKKTEKYYHELIHYYVLTQDAPSSVKPLSETLRKKMDYVIANGDKKQRHMISKFLACAILDGAVKNSTSQDAINIISRTFKENEEFLPEYIYKRIFELIKKSPQDKVSQYISLSFDLKYDDSLKDLGPLLLSNTLFEKNTVEYLRLMYQFLLKALTSSRDVFLSVVFFLIEDMAFYPDVFEGGIELLQNARCSEYWQVHHTCILKNLINLHLNKNRHEAMNEVKSRLIEVFRSHVLDEEIPTLNP